MEVPFRVAVLASHVGSNLQALIDDRADPGSGYETALVISDNEASGALQRARARGIPAVHLSRRVHPDPGQLDGDPLTDPGAGARDWKARQHAVLKRASATINATVEEHRPRRARCGRPGSRASGWLAGRRYPGR